MSARVGMTKPTKLAKPTRPRPTVDSTLEDRPVAMQEYGPEDAYKSIRHNRNTKLENQKSALSLLDATEAILHEKGLCLEPKNYFLALWPLLDSEDKEATGSMTKGQAIEFNTTVIYLVSFVANKLDVEFIKEHYSLIYSKLSSSLERFLTVAPFIRAAVVVLQVALSSFDHSSWEEKSSLNELLSHLLQLAIDPRPKVRKISQDALLGVIRMVEGEHPSRGCLVSFITSVYQNATRKESENALHLIPLLRSLAPRLTSEEVSMIILPLLRSAGHGNNHLSIAVYNFVALLCDLKAENHSDIIDDESGRVMLKFISQQKPPLTVSELIPSWINAFCKVLCIGCPVESIDLSLLAVMEFFMSSEAIVLQAIEDGLRFSYHLVKEDSIGIKICKELGALLQTKNSLSAPYVIRSVGDFCQEAGIEMLPLATELIISLAVAHDSKQAKHANLIEKAIGKFITRCGPELILDIIPLNLEGEKDRVPHAWMLPIIKESVSHGRLQFFMDTFVPLAERLSVKCAQFSEAGKLGDVKVYQLIIHQLWATLSAFMTFPRDFVDVIDKLAPVLGKNLNGNVQLRPIIANALTSFITRCRSLENDMDCTAGEEVSSQAAMGIRCLANYSANFLPILFNIYGATESEQRGFLLDCIEAFLSITQVETVKSYFDRILSRLQSLQSGNGSEMIPLLEISTVLVRSLDVNTEAGRLMEVVLPLMSMDDLTVQKRAYRVVSDLLGREDYHVDIRLLEEHLISTYETGKIDSAVKKARLGVLLKLSARLSDDSLHLIPLFLPEVVLATKEINQQTRLSAFELLLAFARRMSRGGVIKSELTRGMLANDTVATLDEFMTMLIAGLAGATPHMISASIMAIARVLFEMRSAINHDLLSMLFCDIIAILHSPSREVVKSALGFIKVTLVAIPRPEEPLVIDLLDAHLPNLVDGLLNWSNEHHQQFKVRVRHLIERLVRRFGFERIWELTPKNHQKLLTNIRKRRERMKRQKAGRPVMGEGDHGASDEGKDAFSSVDAFSSSTRFKPPMTGPTALRPSARFESALNDSASDFEDDDDDDDNYEMPQDSILRDLANVDDDDDDEIETILNKRLSLSNTLSKSSAKVSMKAKRRVVNVDDFDNNDDHVLVKDGKLVINEEEQDEDDDVESDSDEGKGNSERKKGKKKVRFTGVDTPQQPTSKRPKNQRGDSKKKEDRFEPFTYIPMTRATKRRHR